MSTKRSSSALPGSGRGAKEYDISKLLELALGTIRQSVIIADGDKPDAPIVFANQAFRDLTGYAQDEIIGRNCRFLAGPETSAETRAEIKAAIHRAEPFQGLILNYRRDGTAFWNELHITPVEDQTLGRFFVGVQIDVTERRELETRLRESQRLEAIGKLSGGIAHDFNNLLALILGNAELIATDTVRGSVAHEAATDIIEAADGGSKLVERMLQYARGESGEREDIAINAAIEDVVKLLTRTLGEAVLIETDLSPAVGRVTVDRSLLETALLNLLLNARDAMPRGGVVRVSTRRRVNAGPALGTVAMVSVSDTGVGMSEVTKQRAFEPFFTTKETGRGNGLGLAMVYNFVKQAGGDVTIESIVNRGTAVTMLLPLEDPVVRSVGADKQRIMIVEDDAKLRKMLALQFERAGYATEEVASAEEALSLIGDGMVPDLLISDIRLKGGMSGVELVDRLRESHFSRPVLLMTGFSDELGPRTEAGAGVSVLRKPFRHADLMAEAERMIERSRQHGG